MCIIAAKPAGVAMPSRDTIRIMWDGNRDGAGLMYLDGGKVTIEKGFMTYKSFAKKLDQLEKRLDLTRTPVVMHFRITTHGGTKPENCHPFPITDSIGALKKLNSRTDIGVAHNGIIHIIPRSGISDTMEYIASQLAPLKRALPRFYENKNAMLLVKNAIDSRMAFLTKEGKIYTVGDFIEDEGVLYSNSSYLKPSMRYRNLDSWNCYGSWDDDWGCAGKPPFQGDADTVRFLMWLDEGEYLTDADGVILDGIDYLADEQGRVYEYDYESDMAFQAPGLTAWSASGTPLRYDFDRAEPVEILG